MNGLFQYAVESAALEVFPAARETQRGGTQFDLEKGGHCGGAQVSIRGGIGRILIKKSVCGWGSGESGKNSSR